MSVNDLLGKTNEGGRSLIDSLAKLLPGKIFILEIFELSGKIEVNIVFRSDKGNTKADVGLETAGFQHCMHEDDYAWLVAHFKRPEASETDAFQFFARLKLAPTGQTESVVYSWYFLTIQILLKESEEQPMQMLCIAINAENITNHERSFESYFKDTSFFRTNRSKFLYLTFREKEVLYLLSKGYTNRQTSLKLGISEQTVKTHRKKVVKKLQTANPMELANYLVFFE